MLSGCLLFLLASERSARLIIVHESENGLVILSVWNWYLSGRLDHSEIT